MTKRHPYALTLILSVAAILTHRGDMLGQSGSCGPGTNPVVCENLQPGAPASEWDVSGAGDASIQGFATDISVDQGQTVRFKVKTSATAYRLDIYRVGYYQGLGARKMATVTPSASLPQMQPACLTVPETGLVDCGNWSESASWIVPSSAASGVYMARLVRTDTGGASHIPFIVRDDNGGSEMLFQTSDTTWQAYNTYGGNSLYLGAPAGRAYKVSYNRPFIGRDRIAGPQESNFFNAEYPMVRWLEANGYDVSYTTGVDTARRGGEFLDHRLFLSVGHDEYWSAEQRASVEAARNAGVHLAFFSGNEMFWKTRWENDSAGTANRTLVCYKETTAGAKIDPSPIWTGTWRDPRFSPPADGGRPENALTGTLFMVNGTRDDAITVPSAEGRLRFWRNTSLATLPAGQTATLGASTLGYEWDVDVNNGSRPAGLIRLSSTTVNIATQYLLDYGSTYGAGTANHALTLYRHSSGALVFGAGTVQWSWGLDATHDRSGPAADPRMQQATVNLFADMGIQPRSLQAGLVSDGPSSDTLAPTSTIVTPAGGASVQSGTPVTVSGTAQDQGGGRVAAIEVSVDGGLTWRAASGREAWTYSWTPAATSTTPKAVTIISRAVDDSSNVELPGAGVTVTVLPLGGLVAAYGFSEGRGTQAADLSGNNNHGTIAGATWTAGKFGRALAFNGVSGWVTVNDANSLDLTNKLTLEAWINPVTTSGWQSAIIKETATGLAYALYANDNLPRPSVTLHLASDTDVPGAAGLPLNTWSHVAATYDGATARLYVNGTLVTSMAATGNVVVSAAPLRIGGNNVWGEFVNGAIDEVRIYNRALSVEEIQSDMTTEVGGTPLPDTVAPTVSISTPAAGATVAGSTTVTGTAADDTAVVGVQFLLDGAVLGAEDLTAPYSVSWTTTAVSDGPHTLAARARDAAGNTATSAGVTVAVANTPDSTAPTVSISAPASGATLQGTVPITATASDNVAVAGVTFFIDGAQFGAEDLTAPYATAWDTGTTTNGIHALTARARDAAGNTKTSAAVSVTLANVTPSNLVAAYGFDEGSGTTVADASGLSNTGTIAGATWTPVGKFGKALSFNGSTSWVTVNDASSLDLTTGMTLEAWVNPSALGGWREVILKETSNALAYGLYANDNNPYPAATINLGGADRSAIGAGALTLNAWTHLAATYDGVALKLFVNGVQAQSVAVSGSMLTSASPLRIGGNAVWGEDYSGLIDEVRVYNRALSAAEIQADMTTAVGGSTPGDTTPPSVSVTAPAQGSQVAGTIKVTATASDASGLDYVDFRVDGVSLGTPDATAPYESYWNTGALANGSSHTITAVARDTAGNLATSAARTVTINNPTDAASIGAWSAPFDLGFVAVNMVLLDTGKVLAYPGWGPGGTGAKVFTPASGALTAVPIPTHNIFCSGHATLADGRILVVGGWDDTIIGSAKASIFDPVTQSWTRLPDMAYRRWYPTATTLADGRVLVTSGATTCETCLADVPEVFDPVTNTFTQLTSARLAIPYYPLAFLLPSGKVLTTGLTDTAGPARTLDVATQTWSVLDPIVPDGSSAAMYLPGKVLQSGTASDPSFVAKPSSKSSWVFDATLAVPAWRATAPMAYPRAYNNLTILPDGSVLAIGGGTETSGRDLTKSVLAAERWSPVTELWTTMAPEAVGRLYHSTSLLLPDGRVLVAGGGDLSGATSQNVAEYYSPPYLFKGARPSITASPSVVDYGSAFVISTPDAAAITSVALIRTGAATHAFDENQRYVPLVFEPGSGSLTLHAPASANVAPPGHYLLFIVNSAGVPSVAPFVRLPAPYEDALPPSAPAGLTATGGIGSVALSWTAATDNIGVAGYNVHRSTTAGFTPSAGNRIAQPAGTAYTDAGVAAGTYYYLVVARDVAGNLSAASNQASATATTDTTVPSVSMTSPANGATVSATLTLSANASDNVGVAGVQFLLDGAALGAEDQSAPYSMSWDSRSVANGAHTLAARARDAAGNLSTSSVSVTVSNTAAPPPTGLIAAYAFDEGSGTTTADATGKGHTGTLTSATWNTGGKTGNALSFNGTNAWVTVNDANDLDLTNGMTLEAWVKPSALSGWNSVIMKEGTTTTLSYALYANDSNPWPALTVRIGSFDRQAVGTSPVALGVWTHLAATYDGATLRLYVNGVQVGTRTQTGNMTVSTRTLRIGGNAVWGEYFSGLIDDVRVYNRALTATEIQTDMNAPVR